MKKVCYLVFLLILIIININIVKIVKAEQTIKDFFPEINIEGIDKEKYTIEKELTKDYIIINIKEKDGDLYYSWKFKKDKIKDNKLDLNFELSFRSNKKEEIDAKSRENNDKVYLNFKHHGNIPSEATLNVYVGNKYKDNQKLYLYYYNEKTDKIEFVANNIKVKDGYASFTINHCSEYFLTGAVVNNAVGNPKTLNRIIIGLGLFIFVLVSMMLFSKK